MAAAAQVKAFAKANGMKVNAAHGVPMLSKGFAGGAMWLECFDSYSDALAYVEKARNAYRDRGTDLPWNKPNVA
jgi:hypothetical protein